MMIGVPLLIALIPGVLVQKLQNICKYSLKLGHTDTITLKKGRDQYGKTKSIQVETLST